MSRIPMPLHVGDISSFARSLRRMLGDMERVPSHLEMLNLLARAGGYGNFQHFKARADQDATPVASPDRQAAEPAADTEGRPSPQEINHKRVRRLARFFDQEGRLIRWPKKFTERVLCLWVMWSRIPPREIMTEQAISRFLEERHLFGDHALLRRELVDQGMVARTPDGREYTRLEQQPPAEALELLKQLRPS